MNFNSEKYRRLIFEDDAGRKEEGPEVYEIGGCHPGYIGEMLSNRYVLMRKIGQGRYSSMWLARDLKFDIFVSIKIYKSSPAHNEIAFAEFKILKHIDRKSREKEWITRLSELKKKIGLPVNTSANENFCVRYFY